MKNVSFGRIIFPQKLQERTLKQSAAADVIENVFYRERRPLGCISTLVHNRMRADILVKNLKNGDVEITFQKSEKPANVVFPKDFIDENIGKLVINGKSGLASICENVEQFADKCYNAILKLNR